MTMGYYNTKELPIYEYLHSRTSAPNYVVLDHFFQAAFGGSFLNHQYLVAAAAPPFPAGTHSVLDANGFPNANYPLYATSGVVDGPVTQACGLPTTVPGLACGDYAVNTVQPFYQPTSAFGARMPHVDDTTTPLTIGDTPDRRRRQLGLVLRRLGQRGRQRGRSRLDERRRPDLLATRTRSRRPPTAPATAASRTARTSRSRPTTSRSTTSPATRRASPDRAHLQDEQDFLYAAKPRQAAGGQLRQAARQRERAPRLHERAERQRPPRRPDPGRSSTARRPRAR